MVMAGVTYHDIKEIILIAIGVHSGLWEDLSESGCYNNYGADNVSWLSERRMAEIAMEACTELVRAIYDNGGISNDELVDINEYHHDVNAGDVSGIGE